jgi:hypothetical protein
MAAQGGHRRRGFVEVGADQTAPIFGIEPRRKGRGPDEIAENHRYGAALGSEVGELLRRSGSRRGRVGRPGLTRRRRLGRGFGLGRPERGDRVEELASVADSGDAGLLQVVGRQARKEVAVDRVVAERGFVLAKTQIFSQAPTSTAALTRRMDNHSENG